MHSPPQLAQVILPATPSAEPLTGLAHITASRERLLNQVVDGLNGDDKAAKAAQAFTPDRTTTSRLAPTSPTSVPQEPGARDTIELWHTIMDGSASKRKAKASPKVNVSSSIRKPEAT